MPQQKIHIKNMVCPRCIQAIEGVLADMNIPFSQIVLGQAVINRQLSVAEYGELAVRVKNLGFELLEPGKSALISQIKTLIIEQIHYKEEALTVNFSVYLSEQLNYDYSYLSRLFSSVEGITIEKFITRQKIERIKELLFYDQLTLSEIAFKMNYSSVAYLSAQFKKETGMTPTAFKQTQQPGHHALDSI